LLFKEKENDRYHLITQTAFDMCNILGNTRTCGIREARFGLSGEIAAVEFMRNRFMLTSASLSTIKVTEKCPNLIREIIVHLDSVLLVPDNCSYIASGFGIDIRESDIEITKEIGLASVDKLEIEKIENYHYNATQFIIQGVSNYSASAKFDQNRREIEDRLGSIDTKHTNLWAAYSYEKWIVVGCLVAIVLVGSLLKLKSWFRTKRSTNNVEMELNEFRVNLKKTYDEFKIETSEMLRGASSPVISPPLPTASQGRGTGLDRVSGSMFSSPLNRSQFL
jgi:hypothetical protein